MRSRLSFQGWGKTDSYVPDRRCVIVVYFSETKVRDLFLGQKLRHVAFRPSDRFFDIHRHFNFLRRFADLSPSPQLRYHPARE
jgi:hypothetical protein